MSETTKIEWTDATFNPWIGCTKVSPACDHCYAEVSTPARSLRVSWGAKEDRHRTSAANWKLPLRWNAQHDEFFAEHGRRRRVFCASLADVFDNQVPDAWRTDLFRLIEGTPNLDWLLLTKRIGNARAMSQVAMGAIGCIHKPLPENVWIGATICNQEEADRDIPKLLAVPARVRFLSMEPLLGPVDVSRWLDPTGVECMDVCPDSSYVHDDEIETVKNSRGEVEPVCPHCGEVAGWTGYDDGVDWVIVGGESGASARPMHPDWARSLRDQCAAAVVPFLFKQWGEYLPWTHFNSARIDDPPEQTRFSTMEWRGERWEDVGYPMWCDSADGEIDDLQCVGRVGKKAAGRLLDGRQHDGFPGSSA